MYNITYVTRASVLNGADDTTTTATVSASSMSIGTTIYNALATDLISKGTLAGITMVDAEGEQVMGWDAADEQSAPVSG